MPILLSSEAGYVPLPRRHWRGDPAVSRTPCQPRFVQRNHRTFPGLVFPSKPGSKSPSICSIFLANFTLPFEADFPSGNQHGVEPYRSVHLDGIEQKTVWLPDAFARKFMGWVRTTKTLASLIEANVRDVAFNRFDKTLELLQRFYLRRNSSPSWYLPLGESFVGPENLVLTPPPPC